MKRTILAVLLAAGTLVSAQSFAQSTPSTVIHYGDENDQSWLYTPPSAEQFPADSGQPAAATQIPHRNDTDNLSWMYSPPSEKQFPADSGQPAQASTVPNFGDQDNLSWVYTPPSARQFNDTPTYATAPSSPSTGR